MIPQLSDNIFIVTEPLQYTINVSESNMVNLPVAIVAIDETWFVSPIWNIRFSGVLTSSSTLAAEITYLFSLFKVGDSVPITTFNIVQSLNTPNTPQSSSVVFSYELNGNLPESLSYYRLELTSISSTAASLVDITINSGTIIGYVLPQV